MAVDQSTDIAHQTKVSQKPNPLLVVVSWELRRIIASRQSVLLTVAAFVFFLLMIQWKHSWALPLGQDNHSARVTIIGTTSFGILYELINVLLLLYGMFLPFVVTNIIARDYKRRVHEVIMTTPVPTRAFVWGRFFAALVVSVFLALVVLVAFLIAGQILHSNAPDIPVPDFATLVPSWALVLLPAAALVCAVGFTLGTLYPRLATPLQIAQLVAWLIFFTLSDVLQTVFGPITAYFNPTSVPILVRLIPQFIQNVLAQLPGGASAAQVQQIGFELQQVRPDLMPWVIPYLGFGAVAGVLVAIAALRFKRFRDVME